MSDPAEGDLNSANPHALATIVEASAKRTIVASDDIYDERGVKLWARGQPVSESLQQKLLERKLKQPLEASLQAADGVNGVELKTALDAFLSSDHALAAMLKPWGAKLLNEVAALSVQSVAQLLLTAAQAARPGAFDHAVRGMALSGAICLSKKSGAEELRLALLGGLLHDLGEMYVNPDYLGTSQPLDMNGYRHLAVHPRTGQMLLSKLAGYPAPVARAVGEHHERLDGSGYPGRLVGQAISPLGLQLAVVELVLGIASSSKAPWAHSSFALRMVPGEFGGPAVGFVAATARQANEDLTPSHPVTATALSLVDGRLAAALVQAEDVERTATSPAVRAVAQRARHLLFRLRIGWNEMGLWFASDEENESPQARFEMSLAGRELAYRMRFIRRECLWSEKELSESDTASLTPLWESVEVSSS